MTQSEHDAIKAEIDHGEATLRVIAGALTFARLLKIPLAEALDAIQQSAKDVKTVYDTYYDERGNPRSEQDASQLRGSERV